ncbi:LacI family DNA-binding transcriptional regulator [Devosia sp.]|uniref:LacI family DNA-binding transcriptional regulator n=1 Tax=Devosia sp. TaxID=1871048 RepID=UPI001AC9FB14|nr:LacI family DNA-binding transcriptional regulator [Devosia sp.]MBN9310029.1 LacI family DNA-binding transcriptional regulator [Devosia sp.]
MTTTSPRLTLVDVAREAGVSRGTASNVFTHPERVRAEVRERVLAVARRIGYAGPNPRGQVLRAGRFNALGFIVPGAFGIANLISSPYGRELVLGIADACDAAGVSLTIIDGNEPHIDVAIRKALVDGFVVGHTGHIAALDPALRRRVPISILDVPAGADVSAVSIDGCAGARMAAEHLVGLGHRRFAILSVRRNPGPAIIHRPRMQPLLESGYQLDADKLRGFADCLAAHGLSIAEVPIVETQPVDPDAGRAILDAAPDATAIFCMSDRQAVTLLGECSRRGVVVPRDLSVVGFDGVPEAAATQPPLTTVAQPIREKGRRAAEMTLRNEAPRQVELPVELVVRSSTAPPRG